MSKDIATLFVFASDSSPGKTYQTLLYVDGTTSCECPGWKFKRKTTGNGDRTCKHTRFIDAGMANVHAVKMVEYARAANRPAQRAITPGIDNAKPVRRVFDFSE